ncbi:mucin-2-like isoform X4 [Sander lucioperca]|uniref:mucin-2-like isoform X4 n=1 Tax=Sander lucioperca TaxID=283035 RepID=UPI001653644B|nr:mucin-2-like isoform X4 [Sander lucioperca]
MRLTALCICGTLLAFSSLSWTSADADEGDVLGDNAFRPCAATLRPEGLCRQGQEESTCPYLFSLPPLTLHLPKQLRELEKIVTDLQKLKDNVDQLRKMCADCTVSQTERECGRQRERGHEKLNEGTDRHKDERNWLNERNPKRPKDFSQECGTDSVKAEKTMEGDGDTDSEKRTILEEKGRKKWEAERESDKVVVKENQREETLKVAEKDGKTKTEGAKQKDKLEPAKVPTAGGNEKIVDMVRKKVVEKNNRETETDRKKDNNGKGNSKGDPEDTLENGKERKITSNVKNKEKTEESDHHVWQDETKETEKNTQTEEDRGSDGIKMSEGHDEHTNQEREQHREERKKEMEKGIKVERNNEKPKQTESIGHAEKEKTIKEGEVEDGETGTEIKTEGEKTVQSVQRDSDGELASSKATERTDFVSISPTAQSIISLAPRQDAMDSNEVITFTSSLPSPFLSSSTLHLITDVNQGMTIVADGLPTQSTGFGAAVISEHPSPDAEEDFRATSSPTTTATLNTLGGPGQQITSATSRFTSTTSARPDADFQGRVSSTTATTTTTTPRQNLYTTTSPGVADRSRWTAKKNISSNTKTGVKPLPGREPKPSEKHKPAIKPEADQRLKNPRNDRKPVRAPLPDKKTKLDQKSKPGKDPKQVQIPTPEQRPLLSHLPTDQNLKNNQIPKHDQEHTADQSQLPIQKPTTQKPQTVNPTGSDKDLQTGREPESVEIPITSQNSKLEKKLVHLLKSDKPDQPQKTKPDQRSTINQYFPPVQKPEPERSETTSLPPTPNQKPITELMEYADENPLSVNDSTPNQKPITELMEYADENPLSVNDSTPNQKPITELMEYADENPLSVNDLTPEQEVTPDRPLINPPDQKPKPSQNIPKINQKSKPNQKHPDLTTSQKTKPHVKPKPDQTAQTNQGLITPQPDQMPDLNPKSVPDKIPEAESNKTSKLRPPPIRRPPTRSTVRPTVRPGATPIQRPKPAVQQKPSPKTKADLDPLQINGTKSEDIQNSQIDMPPVSSPGTQIAEVSHSPGDTEFSPRTERSETTSLTPTPNQKPITELMEYADENPLSVNDLTPEQEVTPDRPLINPPDQKPKPSQNIPKINQKSKPNQKHPDLTTSQKTKPHVKPKPDQTAQTNQGLITPQPDQMPDLNPKSAPDKIPEAESNKTSKPRPPPIRRPPTRPTVRPGATPVQMPKPAVQQKPSPKTKADLDPLQTSETKSEDIQNSQTDMPPALSPGRQIAEVSHSPGDTEFSPITMQTITLGPKTSNSMETGPFPRLHTLSEGFTMSQNSRITSDLRPQTTSRPPSIPMTTSPQKSVIPSISPGSDSRSQAKILHNVEETAPRQTPDPDKMMIPVPTPSAQTTSTNSPDLRSTTPATSGPEPLAAESSTPSARELRVKINQVAAFFNNSLSPNRRPPDRRTKEHPEDNQGGSRPDSKLPTLITSKVNTASDCSNHLLRGETKSGVYLVTPDLRSKSFPVFCDMELDGGGWTLLQRRQDGSVSFNRTWAEYRSGFGELDGGEFWLGNNMIHLLTRDRDMVLRVELEDFNGVMEYAEYEQFRVASERMRYRLTVGGYSGTAGDALRFSRSYDHNNRAFTTPDRDHDRYPSGNCGAYYSSGWWFDACMAANLNGRYYVGSYRGVRDGIFWGTWHNISNEYYPTNDRQSFKAVTMMIRPKGFTP